MLEKLLNGLWRMKRTDETDWIPAKVPGSVLSDLLREGKLEDPFYRDNEDCALQTAGYDYEYLNEFEVDGDLLAHDRVLLVCEGLDTLAEIRMNGQLVASTDNMHRTYEFEVKSMLRKGGNTIHVRLRSPVRYIEERQAAMPLWGVPESLQGYPHIRKAHCMFGWDWGPKLPDAGIWRSLSLKGYKASRIHEVRVVQNHTNHHVILQVHVSKERWSEAMVETEIRVTSPSGSSIIRKAESTAPEDGFVIEIDNPELWWPNGYGGQPLYQVEVFIRQDGTLLDERKLSVGLRTIHVDREPDQWGEKFAFVVNGIPIFAKGANYIPEDSLLSRMSPQRTERLLKDCVEAHFNMIRVWGGGIYPENIFYDLCDRYGLIVWQDFMFACGVYEMNDAFTANIAKEAEDNIKRIRHHACLGIWCGNNEMEWAWEEWDMPKPPKLRTDYIKQFEVLLPDIVKKYDPHTFYWPASPSSCGSFDDPNAENRGDVHYWDVWHGLKPFTEYRKFHFRFCSEFGFQSFPALKTVESFTLPEDRNIFSFVMEKHQKNNSANGKILYYLSQSFKYPNDFDSLLYTSQILQAEAIKYGVEHWRRHRGRCMGSIYWQLNDCWPAASWSSIDYYGRWKALHYFAKRFYTPVLLSACDEGREVELHVTNDMLEPVSGNVIWVLRKTHGDILKEGTFPADVGPLTASMVTRLDFNGVIGDQHLRTSFLEYRFVLEDRTVSAGTLLFVPAKHFEFADPCIRWNVSDKGDSFEIILHSKALAKYTECSVAGIDCKFSDNYFDLVPGTSKTVEVRKDSMSEALCLDDVAQRFGCRTIYETDKDGCLLFK